MFYNFTITVSPGTAEDTAEETVIKLSEGVITHAECYFTEKCQGQVHIAIRDALHQVWPTNPEEQMRGEKQAVPFEAYHEITHPSHSYTVKAWNTDDSYFHTVILRFVVVRPAEELYSQVGLLFIIAKLLGFGQPGVMVRL